MRKQYFSFIFLIFSQAVSTVRRWTTISSSTAVKTAMFLKKARETTPSYKTPERPNMKLHEWGATVQPHMFMAIHLPGRSQGQGSTCPQSHPPPCHTGKCIFDDTRICYFNLSLSRQGKKAAVQFSRTFHDLRYLHVSTFRRNTSSARNVSPSPFLPHCPVSGWWRRTSVPVSGVKRA